MINKIIYLTYQFFIILLLSLFLNNQTLAEETFFYKWVDKDGVTHVTDKPESVPNEYRNKITKYEKKESSSKSNLKAYLKEAQKLILQYKYYLLGIAILFPIWILIKKASNKIKIYSLKRKIDSSDKLIKQSGIKDMSQNEFEEKSKEILINSGYKLKLVDSAFKTDTNFIAERKGKNYAVHISSNINPISISQINNMKKEKERYNSNGTIIISKTSFDNDALELAKKTNCKIIDEYAIAKAIVKKSKI